MLTAWRRIVRIASFLYPVSFIGESSASHTRSDCPYSYPNMEGVKVVDDTGISRDSPVISIHFLLCRMNR